MKKLVCLFLVLAVCAGFAMPVMADTFVPSVTYKPTPDVEDATLEGEDVTDCLIITSVEEAEEKSTDITQDDRDLLLSVYEQLSDGTMTLDLDSDYVIRELVDVSFKYDNCRTQESHGNKPEILEQEGVTLEVDFDLGVGSNTEVIVMAYVEGQEQNAKSEPVEVARHWESVKSVVNNGDGTVTVVFEDICPVVFVVKQSALTPPAQTGDAFGRYLPLWIILLILSAVALVAVVIRGSRKKVW